MNDEVSRVCLMDMPVVVADQQGAIRSHIQRDARDAVDTDPLP